MPSERVANVLRLASEWSAEERAELADELWSTVPDVLSPEWKDEIRRRVAEADAGHARGEAPGLALTFDEMLSARAGRR
jgi:putative addiction module component